MTFLNLGSDHTLSNLSGASELNHLLNSPFFTDGTELRLTVPLGNYKNVVLCQENGHVKQREIAEFRQLLFSG